MMLYPAMRDLLEKVPSRYELVNVVACRARQISTEAETAEETPAPVARPMPTKPQMQDVIKKQQADGEFSQLLHDASARFGRPISHGDMETLLYLYDTAGMPASVILMAMKLLAMYCFWIPLAN